MRSKEGSVTWRRSLHVRSVKGTVNVVLQCYMGQANPIHETR